MNKLVNKNDEYTLQITGTTGEGNGVGRHEGMAVFVPGAAEGDTALVRIVKPMKNYAFGKLIEVTRPSPDRIVSDCPVSDRCGGCVFRHISYTAEKRIKRTRVADALSRIGGLAVTPELILAVDSRAAYRNKAQYSVGRDKEGKLQIGFYAPHSHRIIDCRDCLLQPREFARAVEAAAVWIEECSVSVYDETSGKGLLRRLYLRKAYATGEILFVAVINGKQLPFAERLIELLRKELGGSLKSVQYNVNTAVTNVVLGAKNVTLYGGDTITDVLCGLKIRISPLSFYQVNRAMAEQLYEKAKAFAEPDGKTILDLYCGAGSIGLSMAKDAKQVIGVEIIKEAVDDAVINAIENGIDNSRFICADAAEAAGRLANEGIHPDVVIVDPPRKGCSPLLLECIARRFKPERVVYISCDPATLARDCKILLESGYRTEKAVPADLFPGTAHVETIVLLQRQNT